MIRTLLALMLCLGLASCSMEKIRVSQEAMELSTKVCAEHNATVTQLDITYTDDVGSIQGIEVSCSTEGLFFSIEQRLKKDSRTEYEWGVYVPKGATK